MFDFFDSIFRFDSPFMLKASRFGSLILLNLLWVVCCLPVITIGPATVAMHYVIFQYHTERSDQVFRPFFKSFRRDFLQSVLLGIPVSILCVLLVFNGLFIYGNYPDTFTPLWIPYVLLVLITGGLLVYGFPQIARYSLNLRQIVSNSLIFLTQNLKFSLGAMFLYFLPVLVWILIPGFFSNFAFFWVLIGGSLSAYLNNKTLLKIFESEQE